MAQTGVPHALCAQEQRGPGPRDHRDHLADAPAASKGLEVKRDGIVFTVVRTDLKIARVWWKADGVLYFVSNTLSYWLDQEEMLAIAESMIPIPAR
jgi:hypothetical protein